MVKRSVLLFVVATILASCSTDGLARREVPDVVRGAFRAASVEVSEITVTGPELDGRWPVSAKVSGAPLQMEVDGDAGRVTRIELGRVDSISRAQLEEIGTYASNPADDRARRTRRAVALSVVFAVFGVGLLSARRRRLGETADGSSPSSPASR